MPFHNSELDEDIVTLIENYRMVCNKRIIRSFTDFKIDSYRILDRPLPDMVIDDLKKGSWTVTELSVKYGVGKEDIDDILGNILKNCLYFIEEHKYIPRRVGRDERPGKRTNIRYSLIPIPIHARLFDITLGMSLLGWDEKIRFHDNIEYVPADSIQQDYCEFISEYWEIPTDKVLRYFSKEDIDFVMSRCGPLPVMADSTFYQKIRENISESPDFLRYQFTAMDFERFKRQFDPILAEGIVSFSEMQYCAIQLCDALSYQRSISNTGEVKDLERINEELFEMFFIS
ncbi:hypothetical protein [Methanocalculus sp.]|uniref:hypothetical protein n=1 Tax=Methanocalculus sp. TaxID=2004547 RepID=UPI0026168283|nr:hypothetical protein [Methanocalculus sp.]MDG6251460.1 hypothetical protein [Methanocalculus sp.]